MGVQKTPGERTNSVGASSHDPKVGQVGIISGADGFEMSMDAARAANEEEHALTVKQALRTHWKAVAWSLICSLSIIMEGYDTVLIFSFFAYPSFKKNFGQQYADGRYEVPGQWQSALGSVNTAGCIIGAFLNGYLVKMFGFRPTFILSLIFMCGFIFISFFGQTVLLQTIGQALCGIPWGVFATIGPAYSSELLPLALRPYLTAYTNMCFAIGQFIAAGVVQSMVHRTDEWSYRIPFAIQWVWPAPLIIIAWFMPESPWWLSRKGRYAEAEATLVRLAPKVDAEAARRKLAMMVHTNNIEKDLVSGSSYTDCYRGTNLRRTEIACVTFAGQVLSGSAFAYSATYFFEQAGMSSDNSYKLGLGGTAIAFIGTVISWFLMSKFGRRNLYLAGMANMTLILFIIGILTVPSHSANPGLGWAQSVLCILWLLTFSLTVGPIGWTVPAEVSSTRLRSKTICLARNTYYLANLVANIVEPYFMNPTELNWRGFTGFFWCGTAFITLVWAFFRLTETKDRTFEELDLMFGANVPTRQFGTYKVDAYAENSDISHAEHNATYGTSNEKC